MKTLKLLLIALLFASCSAESIDEDPEPIFIDRCGIVEYKQFNTGDSSCYYKIAVKVDESSTFYRCLTETEFGEIEVGDEYCYGQIQIN